MLKRTLKEDGVRLLSVTENIEDTPEGRKNETIKAAEAQCDNEERSEKCTLGMRAAVELGKYVWQAPLGYLNGGRRIRKSLVLGDEQTVALVRKSFDLVDSCVSTVKALEEVRREGLRSHNGNELSLNTFRTMLMNRTYTGYITAFGMTVKGDFDPIVPEDVFFRVQPKLHRKTKAKQVNYQRNNPDFPLRGAVRCPECGHIMTASQSRGNGREYGYYACSHCQKSWFRKELVEGWFVERLRALSLSDEARDCLEIAVDTNLEESRRWVAGERKRITDRMDSLARDKTAIINKCLAGIIPDTTLKEWLESASSEEELRGRLALTEGLNLDAPDVIKRGLAVVGDLASFWENSNLSIRQQLQEFVFPQGITAGASEFGTDPIALCLRPKELPAYVKSDVVGPPGFEPRTKWL